MDNVVRELGNSEVLHTLNPSDYGDPQDYFLFSAREVPLETILQEPILAKIHQQFPIKIGGILQINPHVCYNWHKDFVRGVSVNMILTPDVKYITMFGKKLTESEYEWWDFKYKPKTFYAFNTQVYHQIINFEQPRFMFTVEFEMDKSKLDFPYFVNNLVL